MLFSNLKEIEPRTHLISVVAGKHSQCGRVYASGRVPTPMQRLVVVGEHLQYLQFDGLPQAESPQPSAIFDSAKAITGSGAMGALSRMTVTIVGASGTGSLFCELLCARGASGFCSLTPMS